MPEQVEQYIKDHEDDFVQRLNTLLKIPSISTASEHAGDVRKACDFVKDQLLGAVEMLGIFISGVSDTRGPSGTRDCPL